ncbi:MAG: hypothetical protein IKM73_12095 [Acidaminococcaceae bacterium]|nr:hypothetical protein [Acidaminococcaceae bacterium]
MRKGHTVLLWITCFFSAFFSILSLSCCFFVYCKWIDLSAAEFFPDEIVGLSVLNLFFGTMIPSIIIINFDTHWTYVLHGTTPSLETWQTVIGSILLAHFFVGDRILWFLDISVFKELRISMGLTRLCAAVDFFVFAYTAKWLNMIKKESH